MDTNQRNEPLEVLWTVPMVAKYLSLTNGAIYNWISTGKIKAVRLSNRAVRIPKSEVERIVGEATSRIKPN